MADDIKTGTATAEDALAVELLNRVAPAAKDEAEAHRGFGGDISSESEAGGGAENVYLSGLLGEFSGATGLRADEKGGIAGEIGTDFAQADGLQWSAGANAPLPAHEQSVDGMLLSSDGVAVEAHGGLPLSGNAPVRGAQVVATPAPAAAAAIPDVEETTSRNDVNFRSTDAVPAPSGGEAPAPAPAGDGGQPLAQGETPAPAERAAVAPVELTPVDNQATPAFLKVSDAVGAEDTAIALDVTAALGDIDGSESLSITIQGVPAGAVLSAGTDNGDGRWTLAPGDLKGLTVTPPPGSDGDFTLTITATSTEADGGATASVSATLDVTVAAVANDPALTVADAAGTEDTAIALDVTAALGDLDGSESLSILIEGVPSGASLSAGTDNGDGSWTLTPAQLSGLTITPPADADGDFTLTVTATSAEADGGATASVSATLDVAIAAAADAPTLAVNDAAGLEDTAIALDVTAALGDLDGSESLSITINGVPASAVLSAGIDNGDGSWTLTPAQLTGLTITPPADADGDFTLTVTATSAEADGGATASVSATLDVSIAAAADAPTLAVTDAAGLEDTAIALDVTAALGDLDGSETLSITIDGLPAGATLSAGTDNGDGSWTLSPAQLTGLTITPPADADGDFTLTVTATSTEADGGATASVSATLDVSIAAAADAPTFAVNDAAGLEDAAIALDVTAALGDLDGSESLSILIEGVPSGALLSAGIDNGDGSWTLTPAQLSGLTITPPADADGDFTLTVTATSTEADGGATASTSAILDVSVAAAADAPSLAVNDAAGMEDSAIALDITGALGDLDGSESLSSTIEGVPAGAVLSAGTDNGDGSWTLTPAQLTGLTITPPADSDGDFTLTVTATSTEADGGATASVSADINVVVEATTDAPTLSVNDAAGLEDTAIALDVTAVLGDLDGSESLSITVDGVPAGAVLSAGTDNGDGSWTLTPAQLTGLTITPPADADGDFTLTVTATSTEANGGATASVTADLNVSVSAAADAPTLGVNDAAGLEDTAIALDVTAALGDLDGSESLSILIEGVPAGATLSAGTDNGDGSWTLTPAQLTGLTITPPADADGDFTLTVTATSTEADGGTTASVSADINVLVEATTDAPTLSVNDAAGMEDSAIALDITGALGDLDGSESLSYTIEGVPAGATLSAGTDNGDGSWTLTPAQLAGLTITPPADADGDFTLTVTATSTEANGGATASVSADIDVAVTAAADAPTLSATHTSGLLGLVVNLDIAAALGDLDGSETLSITIDGVPAGGTLSAGIDNGDGSWTLDPGELPGLQLMPPLLSSLDFDLTVTATSKEMDGGDTASTSTVMHIGLFHDVQNGDGAANTIEGGIGDDQIFGNGGHDTLWGDHSNALLDGLLGGGDDELHGGLGNDTLYGGRGDDRFFGDQGNDQLYGGDGNDMFGFDPGNDNAWGEAGNDLIVFGAGGGGNNSFDGGAGWVDSIRLQDVNGDPSGGDWTLELTVGSIVTTEANAYDLSADSAGKIVMSDGSELTFVGVERIEW